MRGLEAVVRILCDAGLHQAVERRRSHRLDRRDRFRLRVYDRGDQRRLALSRERLLPGRRLVEEEAEGEDVRAAVGLLALQLLGRHVLEGPEDRAFGRQVLSRLGGKDGETGKNTPRLRGCEFRQPEVDELHARLRDHHVARLQVPMHDPLPVGFLQRVGDLDPVTEDLLRGSGPFARRSVRVCPSRNSMTRYSTPS